MKEIYRLQIVSSLDNPDLFELRFSANHVRNQLLVMFRYRISPGIADRLRIKSEGFISVKITRLALIGMSEERFAFDCFSPQLEKKMGGEYSIETKEGFLWVIP